MKTKLDVKKINQWKLCSKTKDILAKPLISLLVDKKVTNKFLLDTLEGEAALDQNSQVCIGGAGDVWQQSAQHLLKKYDVINIDNDGWMVCRPKPGNKANCTEITQDLVDVLGEENEQGLFELFIIGSYGKTSPIGDQQSCKLGDFVLQNRENPDDMWIVDRSMFLNTYDILT